MLPSGGCPASLIPVKRRWRSSWKASPSLIPYSKIKRCRSLWTAALSQNWIAKDFSRNSSREGETRNDAKRNADVSCDIDIFHPGNFAHRPSRRAERSVGGRAFGADQSDAREKPRGGAGQRSA